jgi:hypothetical protein
MTKTENLSFGNKKYASTGRFHVSFKIKKILVYILTNYNVELPEEYDEKKPGSFWFDEVIVALANG